MSRLWSLGISVTPEADAQQHLVAFRANGRRHVVERVWRQWLVEQDWFSEDGSVLRRYWLVSTRDGLLCTLARDELSGAWCIVQVYD